jgi:hypothetical protein
MKKLLLASLFSGLCALAPAANAEFAAMGPPDPANHFPLWISDNNGLALQLCTNLSLCYISPAVAGNAWSTLTSFGQTVYYNIATTNQGTSYLSLALSGGYVNDIPADGNQVVTGRIKIKLTNLTPGGKYMVTHPWLSTCAPVEMTVPDGVTTISTIQTISSVAPFGSILTPGTPIGPYITWDPKIAPLAPAGYVGDPNVNHSIVGGVCPANNVFKVTGPLPDTTVVINRTLFSVAGQISPVPLPPSGLAATAISNSEARLNWIDNASTEKGQSVERCMGIGCTDFIAINGVASNITTYIDSGLTPATPYNYRIRAWALSGATLFSPYSNIATVTTPPGIVETKPAAPSALAATAKTTSKIVLSWTDNANNETSFLIERCKGLNCSAFSQVASVGANVTTYSSASLRSGSYYSYRVRATNAVGTSAYSILTNIKTLP